MMPSQNPGRSTQLPAAVTTLVNTITTGQQKQRGGTSSRQQLQQLLTEYFDAGIGDSSIVSVSSAGYEASLDINLKLVEVVTSLGVSVLLEDNPFSSAPTEASYSEATNSLLVIRTTIKRAPVILLSSVSAGDGGRSSTARPPLYLWLASRLIPLLGHANTEPVVPNVVETLQSIIIGLAGIHEGWELCSRLIRYCSSCLQSLIHALQEAESLENSKFKVRLPGESYIAANPSSYVDSLQFTVRGLDYALLMAGRVIQSLSACISPKPPLPALIPQAEGMPLFESALCLLRFAKAVASCPNPLAAIPTFKQELYTLSVHILDNLAMDNYSRTRALNFATKLLVDTFNLPAADVDQTLEKPLSAMLLQLITISQDDSDLAKIIELRLYPVALSVSLRPENWSVFQSDLQLAIVILISIFSSNPAVKEKVVDLIKEGDGSLRGFKDADLNARATKLEQLRREVIVVEEPPEDGPRKRRKIDHGNDGDEKYKSLISKLCALLSDREEADLSEVLDSASEKFRKLQDEEKCRVVKLLGAISCVSAGQVHSDKLHMGPNEFSDWEPFVCELCDSEKSPVLLQRGFSDERTSAAIFNLLEILNKLDEFHYNPKVRIWGMMSLRRIINHARNDAVLDMANTAIGQWSLHALQSSRRELRLGAGSTIASYVSCAPNDPTILRRNRIMVMDFVRNLSEMDEAIYQESCLFAWSEIARVSEKDEQNIALMSLIDYLGNSNMAIVAMAYNEIHHLAKVFGVSIRKVVAPFFRIISIHAVKHAQTKPQILQFLAELLERDVKWFLRETQKYTLPYMVLLKKTDVIKRIAECHESPNITAGSLIAHSSNLPGIMALLLTQETDDPGALAILHLRTASAELKDVSLGELLRSHEISIAAEILKLYEGRKSKSNQTINALRVLATSCARSTSKKGRDELLPQFFQQNALGIMTLFTDEIQDKMIRYAYEDKIRIVKGIEAMLIYAGESIAYALPQICACLQSCLEIDYLRYNALCAWSAVFTSVPETELISTLGQTISLILQYWDEFDEQSRAKCTEIVRMIFDTYLEKMEDHPACIPSLERIPQFAEFEKVLRGWKSKHHVRDIFSQIIARIKSENTAVVDQALVELENCLEANEEFIIANATSEQPDIVLNEMLRCLLDSCSEYRNQNQKTQRLIGRCLGLIGAIDSNRVNISREEKTVMVFHNYEMADESVRFVAFFLEEKLVKAFLSASDARLQGFLAWGMQELLKFCGFNHTTALRKRDDKQGGPMTWADLSTESRNTLTPFLTSKYVLGGEVTANKTSYPIFSAETRSHRQWLQAFILDLLAKATGENAKAIFYVCAKVIKGQDIGIATFLLPYIVLNVIISGNQQDRDNIMLELMTVLTFNDDGKDPGFRDIVKHCSETVFMLVDRLSRWVEEKRKYNLHIKTQQARQANKHMSTDEDDSDDAIVNRVEAFFSKLPVDVMGNRSFECNAYPRALYYWEQHIRNVRKSAKPDEMELLFERMQHIYSQIDEPDGIEGISTKLRSFNMDQQIIEHKKAGRWAPLQTWYEKKLQVTPNDIEAQRELLNCLKEVGQFDNIMLHVEKYIQQFPSSASVHLPVAIESAWVTENWEKLDYYLSQAEEKSSQSYEIFVGKALAALRRNDKAAMVDSISRAQEALVKGLTPSVTGSLRQCHESMVQLQILSEIETIYNRLIKGALENEEAQKKFMKSLEKKLDILGSSVAKDKQSILAARRAVFQLSGAQGTADGVAQMWLTTSKLARKNGQLRQSFDAILHATKLGTPLATIEHCRLLWYEGNHRKAIRSLEAALDAKILDVFQEEPDKPTISSSVAVTNSAAQQDKKPMNVPLAKAMLTHAKWVDHSGQMHAEKVSATFKETALQFGRWEIAHYYYGRHLNFLLEQEKEKPEDKQSMYFLTGGLALETAKSFMRCGCFGSKYVFRTVPRFLTIWLDYGEMMKKPESGITGTDQFRSHTVKQRQMNLRAFHAGLEKYVWRYPRYIMYTAFSQIISRITHPTESVYEYLQKIILQVVSAYPRQALWPLLAVTRSTQRDRQKRGDKILQQIKDSYAVSKQERTNNRILIQGATRLNDQLLYLCNFEIQGKQATLSLSRDILRGNMPAVPCQLVVPAQSVLTVSLPAAERFSKAGFDLPKHHFPFPSSQPTIESFLDEIDVMSSLQKPRKIIIMGSDGKQYPFLCKPKDDLRKDARLMEFNIMINRLLKRDAQASLRGLHIRTYWVTPLNEECGLIEWVNNMRPLRDIILKGYRHKQIHLNYNEIRHLLDEACSDPSKTSVFTDIVLPRFPPVFHEWFVEKFPEPGAWFAARLAYVRTCAVMSMVGHVLGLGDRHGENILFDETNGETLHVDFNCLFDKGLTFDKPEKVPFRLTQNMVDAFGVTGYEGPFRRTCEVATRVLRANEETLMTVLESFLHDPAVDMVKKTRRNVKVPETPKQVLEVIRNKLQGRFTDGALPLSVEGQVTELIRMAVSPENLCAMYIGWMSFF